MAISFIPLPLKEPVLILMDAPAIYLFLVLIVAFGS